MIDLSMHYSDSEGYVDSEYFEEAFYYHVVSDAKKIIQDVGLKGFLESLYAEEKKRPLTIEEQEAMQVLHDNWEL